jgi:putative ABC transport system substrate-binding protein
VAHAKEVQTDSDVDNALAFLNGQPAGGLLVITDPVLYNRRRAIAAWATKQRRPTVFDFREPVDAGGLMSYGANMAALYRRAPFYADRILKGAKPADLPVQQPTKFELVIDLKTVKALGLTLPPSLLQRADQVIE